MRHNGQVRMQREMSTREPPAPHNSILSSSAISSSSIDDLVDARLGFGLLPPPPPPPNDPPPGPPPEPMPSSIFSMFWSCSRLMSLPPPKLMPLAFSLARMRRFSGSGSFEKSPRICAISFSHSMGSMPSGAFPPQPPPTPPPPPPPLEAGLGFF